MKTGNKVLTDSKFTDLLTCVQRLRTDIEKRLFITIKDDHARLFFKGQKFFKIA
jgi:hypothetical protein